jgi:group I intron endonuclease
MTAGLKEIILKCYLPETKYQIYIFQNKLNNKIYVGQTVDFERRVKTHFKNAKGNHKNLYFYGALRKHGFENFNYFVIEDLSSFEEMNEAEKFWIEYFRSWDKNFGYNLTFGGEGSIPNSATREKMRQAKLGKPNPNMQGEKHPLYGVIGEKHHRFGTQHTEEAKRKISEANVGRIYPNGSQKYNAKINEKDVLFMRKYFIENKNLKTKDIFEYLSSVFNINKRTVESIVYGYSWKHVK